MKGVKMIGENKLFLNHQTLERLVQYWLNDKVFSVSEQCRVVLVRRTQNGLEVEFEPKYKPEPPAIAKAEKGEISPAEEGATT